MVTYARIDNGKIEDAVVADDTFAKDHGLVPMPDGAGIGWTTPDGKTWHPPAPDPRETAKATITDQVRQALTANTTYLAANNPSARDVAAQVTQLTQQCSAIIRLLTGDVLTQQDN